MIATPAPRRRSSLIVVKLGGAQAFGAHLRSWVEALTAVAGSVVVVPGGGPFADAVRTAQARIGYDDAAAHEMAMLAMEQFGWALCGLAEAFEICDSRASISAALRRRCVPVWAPSRMARAARLAPSWDLTSDSLAAWLAGRLGGRWLALVKHGAFAAREPAAALAARGIVDPLFGETLAASGARAFLAGPEDAGGFPAGLRDGAFPEIVPA